MYPNIQKHIVWVSLRYIIPTIRRPLVHVFIKGSLNVISYWFYHQQFAALICDSVNGNNSDNMLGLTMTN